MDRGSRWAEVVAALPGGERARREAPFWSALAEAWGWRTVADAGSGSGFHLALLGGLGVVARGYDLAPWFVPASLRGTVCAGDLTAAPLRPASMDAALCLGNTLSLLPDRASQARALGELAGLVRSGGVVLLQWEDAGAVVAAGSVTRTRRLDDGRLHLRTFVPDADRVLMLAGIVRTGEATALEEVRLLPTDAVAIARLAESVGLTRVEVPARPPGSAATLWLALRR